MQECKDSAFIFCKGCNRSFCLQTHRHKVDHYCSSLPKESVDRSLPSKVDVVLKSVMAKLAKHKGPTQAKIMEMKLKMHAVGGSSVSPESRLYVDMWHMVGSNQPIQDSKGMYFHKDATVGRCIDEIAKRFSFKNENNVKGAKRLELIRFS